MSIIDVTENFTGLGADDQVESDGRVSGSGARYFDVEFDESDNASSRPFMAKADSRVPQLGEAHPYDAWIYVVGRRATVAASSPFVYRVTVNYREILNPLDETPIIEWLSAATSEVVTVDVDGKAIANSSDEPVDPPHTEDFDDLILRATYNVGSFNPVGASNYKGAVNSDQFLGFAPGLAKIKEYSGREIKAITGNYYVAVSTEIHFRKDGWKRKFVDEGYRIKTGTDDDGKPTYTAILDDEGKEVSEPVKLDGEGQKLADGEDPVLIEYETKNPLPFTTEFSRIA